MQSTASTATTTMTDEVDATPKRSNKAVPDSSPATGTMLLPPPLMLHLNHTANTKTSLRASRFSSLEESPLQVRYSNDTRQNGNLETKSSGQMNSMQGKKKKTFNDTNHPSFSRLSMSTILTALQDRNETAPWENWLVSLFFLCSKPWLEYALLQLFPSPNPFPFRHMLYESSTATSPGTITPSSATTASRAELKGIRNYGQTCYLNSVLQSLASLETFMVYLQRLVVWNQQRYEYKNHPEENNKEEEELYSRNNNPPSLSALVLHVLHDINGTATTTTTTTTPPNVHAILEMVAAQHAQFRTGSTTNHHHHLTIGKHPQDAEELLQTLLQSIVQEADLESWTGILPLFSTTTACERNGRNDDEECPTVASSILHHPSRFEDGQDCLVVLPDQPEYSKKDNISTKTPLAPGEEKKQDDLFDVFIPRIDSEDDMRIRMRISTHDEKEDENNAECGDISSSSSLSTAMHMMITTTSATSPSPMSCWIGSALKCRKCQHRRPIHNTPIHSIPVVPLEVSQSLQQQQRMDKSSSSTSNCPPCRLEDCLAEFVAVELVQDVECRSCTIQEKTAELLEDIIMYQQAMESQAKKKSHSNTISDLNHLQRELDQTAAKLRAIHSIDPDDDAPLDDVLRSEEFYLYNNMNDSIPIRRGAAWKRMLLTRLPAVLTIHVQRRYYDPYSNRMTKTSQQVVFPELLDVAPYCAHGGISFSEGFLSQDASSSKCRPIYYRLSSVIEHQGNAFYGHYVCYRRDPTSGQWYFTSDLTVKRVTWNEVSRCQAYLLFYEAFS